MGNQLYVAAVVFAILWAVGFFVLNVGISIHILLLMAAIAVIVRSVQEKKQGPDIRL